MLYQFQTRAWRETIAEPVNLASVFQDLLIDSSLFGFFHPFLASFWGAPVPIFPAAVFFMLGLQHTHWFSPRRMRPSPPVVIFYARFETRSSPYCPVLFPQELECPNNCLNLVPSNPRPINPLDRGENLIQVKRNNDRIRDVIRQNGTKG